MKVQAVMFRRGRSVTWEPGIACVDEFSDQDDSIHWVVDDRGRKVNAASVDDMIIFMGPMKCIDTTTKEWKGSRRKPRSLW